MVVIVKEQLVEMVVVSDVKLVLLSYHHKAERQRHQL